MISIIIFLLAIKSEIRIIINKNKKNIKVCICTIGKKENKYIREFIIYYKNYGIDKIFLYDNNEINEEHFEDVILDYINKGFVKIFDWRGRSKPHFKAINNCYMKYNKIFDWLIFYDIDEYIHLTNYKNIKDFLNEKKFKNCKKIFLNWVFHTDNELIHYDNRSLHERFPEIEKDAILNKNFSQKVKSILRGNISNFRLSKSLHASHIINNSIKACNGFGKEIKLNNYYYMENSDHKYYYIDHYYSKSLEEFVNKINKGSAVSGQNEKFKFFRIIRYFNINRWKDYKFSYIIKNTKIFLCKI